MFGDFLWHIHCNDRAEDIVGPEKLHDFEGQQHEGHKVAWEEYDIDDVRVELAGVEPELSGWVDAWVDAAVR